MVLLVLTPAILSAIEEFNALQPDTCISDCSSVDHKTLAQISRTLLAHRHSDTYRLHNLIQNSSIYTPPKIHVSTGKTPEFVALMARLRREDEERQYAALLPPDTTPQESIHSIVTETSSQLSAILNILFSIIFTALAVWFATSYSSTLVRNYGVRVSMSLMTALIVALAESVLYVSYLAKMDNAGNLERHLVESKEVKRSWELSSTTHEGEERRWIEIPTVD